MSKLTKAEAKAHAEACRLLEQDHLSIDDRWFVLENWQESAQHVNSAAGAFFTPLGLARDFSLEVGGRRVIDLCAGIGTLSFFLRPDWPSEEWPDITCVEINPAYVAVGRKILPEARWIETSVFNLPSDIGHYDVAISNPPFGRIDRSGGASRRWKNSDFELQVIDVASDIADRGAFIIPQMSAPFAYSGQPSFRMACSKRCAEFETKTDIRLAVGVPIDTSVHKAEWRGTAPTPEIVLADFERTRSLRRAREMGPLFAQEAA